MGQVSKLKNSGPKKERTRQLVNWLLPGGNRQDPSLLPVVLSPWTNMIKVDVILFPSTSPGPRQAGKMAKICTLTILNKSRENNDIMRGDSLPELIRVWLGAGVAVRVRFMPTLCWPVPSASAFLAAALSASVWLPWLTVTAWAAGKGCTTPVPFLGQLPPPPIPEEGNWPKPPGVWPPGPMDPGMLFPLPPPAWLRLRDWPEAPEEAWATARAWLEAWERLETGEAPGGMAFWAEPCIWGPWAEACWFLTAKFCTWKIRSKRQTEKRGTGGTQGKDFCDWFQSSDDSYRYSTAPLNLYPVLYKRTQWRPSQGGTQVIFDFSGSFTHYQIHHLVWLFYSFKMSPIFPFLSIHSFNIYKTPTMLQVPHWILGMQRWKTRAPAFNEYFLLKKTRKPNYTMHR